MTNNEWIELFFSEAYEKQINELMLEDRDYVIPYDTINNYVKKLLDNKDNLYYFNKYYLKDELVENSYLLYKLNTKEVDSKIKMLGMLDDLEYIKEFEHIIPYEEFISYKDWGNNNE